MLGRIGSAAARAVRAAAAVTAMTMRQTGRAAAATAKAPVKAAAHAHSAVVSTRAVRAARTAAGSPHAGVLWAAWRQGLAELGTAVSKPLPDSIQVDVPGQIGQPVSMEVYQEKHGHRPYIPE